jgi:hypothetical protein
MFVENIKRIFVDAMQAGDSSAPSTLYGMFMDGAVRILPGVEALVEIIRLMGDDDVAATRPHPADDFISEACRVLTSLTEAFIEEYGTIFDVGPSVAQSVFKFVCSTFVPLFKSAANNQPAAYQIQLWTPTTDINGAAVDPTNRKLHIEVFSAAAGRQPILGSSSAALRSSDVKLPLVCGVLFPIPPKETDIPPPTEASNEIQSAVEEINKLRTFLREASKEGVGITSRRGRPGSKNDEHTHLMTGFSVFVNNADEEYAASLDVST